MVRNFEMCVWRVAGAEALGRACILLLLGFAGSAASQVPPVDYKDTGPDLIASVGLTSGLEYRDLVFDRSAGLSAALTGTYRGVAASASVTAGSGGRHLSEFAIGYSHAIPYFDVHAAAVACEVRTSVRFNCSNARLTLSTNRFERVNADLTFEHGISKNERVLGASVTAEVIPKRLNLRLSYSDWKPIGMMPLEGMSLRMIGRELVRPQWSVHYFLGVARGANRLNPGLPRSAMVAGASLVYVAE